MLRQPSLLAKQVTTLDLISGGRAMLGLGAGGIEDEHHANGFAFPPIAERLDRVEEAARICRAMFDGRPGVPQLRPRDWAPEGSRYSITEMAGSV